MSSETYYRIKLRHCRCRCLIAFTLLMNGVVWGVVAAFYGSAPWLIASAVLAAFGLFASIIERRELIRYYARVQSTTTTIQ